MEKSQTRGESSIRLKTVRGWVITIGGGVRSGWVSMRKDSRMLQVFVILSGNGNWSLLL